MQNWTLIPPSPLDHNAERTTERSSVLFLCLYVCEQALASSLKTKTACSSILHCGRAESEGLLICVGGWADRVLFIARAFALRCSSKVSALWLRHSNPPSPLWIVYKELIFNLVDFFVPKKLHQKCTDPVSTHFYGRFSNCTYPIHPIPLSYSAFYTIQLPSYAAAIVLDIIVVILCDEK